MHGDKTSFALQINLQKTGPQDEQHLQEALQQAASRPFDMATGPMINATLIPIEQHQEATASEEHSLVISTHYSVTDGWSMGVLLRDLSRAYNILKLGEGGPLALLFPRPTRKYSMCVKHVITRQSAHQAHKLCVARLCSNDDALRRHM